MNVQKAEISDISQIARIHIDSWRNAYNNVMSLRFLESFKQENTEKYWLKILSDETFELFTSGIDDQLAGFLLLNFGNSDSNTVELESLYVCPLKQRTGVGSSLTKHAISHVNQHKYHQLFAWVLDENETAKKFYQKQNFRYTGDQKRVKIDGESTFKLLKFSSEIS